MTERPLPTRKTPPGAPASSGSVRAFLAEADRAATRGRLVMVLDATASREATWDLAAQTQAEMFAAAADARGAGAQNGAEVGAKEGAGLLVDLVFFRGFSECKATGFLADPARLAAAMGKVRCAPGRTQIARALGHVLSRAEAGPLAAFVYVGDAFEDDPDAVFDIAGRLALRGVKGFVFQEGAEPGAARWFGELARVTGGQLFAFDRAAPDALRALLRAIGAYAAGGEPALRQLRTGGGAAGAAAAALLQGPRG